MAIAAVSTYTIPGQNMHMAVLLIALIFLMITFPAIGIWLFGGKVARDYLQNPIYLKRFNMLMALMLALSIALIFIE